MDKKINATVGILSLLGIGVISMAIKFPKGSNGLPGAGFFPIVLGVILLFLCVLLFKSNLDSGATTEKDEKKPFPIKTMISIVGTLIYIIALNYIGFIVSTVLILTGLMMLFDKKSIKLNLGISLATTLIIYYVFGSLLNVPLPEAMLFM